MRDLFDEFMDELRRRQEAAAGRAPKPDGGELGPEDEPPDEDVLAADPDRSERAARAEPSAGDGPDGADELDGPPPGPEPTPIDGRRAGPGRQGRRRSRPGGRGPRRPVGGPEDGAGEGRPGMGPRIGLFIAIAIVVLVLLLGGTIITFVTDAIWFRSVGFESVFWTRIGTQAGLFIGTLVVGLIVLLGGLL